MADILQKIASNLYEGENKEVAALVQQALDQGLTPKEFCRKAGISNSTYYRLKKGNETVKDSVLFKIAGALGVKPSEIIYWERT